MLWVVQNNLSNEPEYNNFIRALNRFELPHVLVKTVPFSNRLLPVDFDSMTQEVDDTPEPEIDESHYIMAFGTITLSRIAIERGWRPGTFLNSEFDFEVWRYGYGNKNILNGDAFTTTVGFLFASRTE